MVRVRIATRASAVAAPAPLTLTHAWSRIAGGRCLVVAAGVLLATAPQRGEPLLTEAGRLRADEVRAAVAGCRCRN